MNEGIEWLAIAPGGLADALRDAIATAIEREHEGHTSPGDVLADSARRRVIRADAPAGPIVLKHHRARMPRRLRDTLRRPLLGSPAEREWSALTAAAGAVTNTEPDSDTDAARSTRGDASDAPLLPQALALVRTGDSDWLVSRFIEARPLLDVVHTSEPAVRQRLLARLGRAMRALATSRVAHGDLHVGNILVCGELPVFVDWQASKTGVSDSRIAGDLADLEFSLAREGVARSDRMRLRQAALGEGASRAALRKAGRRADDAAHDHYRGRTRRSLAVGRRFAAIGSDLGRGMRLAEISDTDVSEALAAHDRALRSGSAANGVLKDDARSRVSRIELDTRSCIVKEVTKGGLGRQVADPFRGSPARRGWLGGHGVIARGLEACEPLAFLDLAAGRSILLLDDASPRACLGDDADPAWKDIAEDALVDALLGLLLRLHRRGVDHGDLQASHLFGDVEAGAVRSFTLIDLEGIRFERKLGDAARLRALAELNASLDEARLSNAARREIFECYARALPFAMKREEALQRVIDISLARRHRWTATGCETLRSTSRY